MPTTRSILVHLGAGIGNIVLATPLLLALDEMGYIVDVILTPDYRETQELLRPWRAVREVYIHPDETPRYRTYDFVIPAIPPFYEARFGRVSRSFGQQMPRPASSLFYQDEQGFYLSFARDLGYPAGKHPPLSLPIGPTAKCAVTTGSVALAPGCKTGLMASKRWSRFAELAKEFADVVLVGKTNDLCSRDGDALTFPSHVRSFVDTLTLRQTAELMAGAGIVVANDSGLAHVAAAIGVPTIMIFGPTPHRTLEPFPDNVTILRQGLPCEPCWAQARFEACGNRVSCLEEIRVETVVSEINRRAFIPAPPPGLLAATR